MLNITGYVWVARFGLYLPCNWKFISSSQICIFVLQIDTTRVGFLLFLWFFPLRPLPWICWPSNGVFRCKHQKSHFASIRFIWATISFAHCCKSTILCLIAGSSSIFFICFLLTQISPVLPIKQFQLNVVLHWFYCNIQRGRSPWLKLCNVGLPYRCSKFPSTPFEHCSRPCGKLILVNRQTHWQIVTLVSLVESRF